MHVGILVGDEPVSTSPRDHVDKLLRQVYAAQEAGVDHIVIGQHFLYEGLRWLQPIPTLARIAAETDDHVRVGTQIMISPLYHPVVLAEELATLDMVTGGRLVVGLGIGYRTHEYENLDVPFDERVGRFEEGVRLIRDLWTNSEVRHEGTYYQVHGSCHLHPLQDPHPPLWIGGQSPGGVRRAARLGATWAITPQVPAPDIEKMIGIFAGELRETGQASPGWFPLRREIMVGRDRDDALQRFSDVARERYLGYAARDMSAIPKERLEEEFADVALSHAVLGTPDEVVEQLTQLARRFPVNPIIFRPHWPGMEIDAVEDYLATMGRNVIPALKELTPRAPLSV